MCVGLVLLQLRQESPKGRLRISDKAKVYFAASSELFAPHVNLHDGRVLWKELGVRKICADHQERVAIHHRVIAGRESEQPRHAYVKGGVVLDELFSAHAMNDGSVWLARQLDQLSVSSCPARAAQDRYFLRAVQNRREDFDLLLGGAHGWFRLRKVQPRPLFDGIA